MSQNKSQAELLLITLRGPEILISLIPTRDTFFLQHTIALQCTAFLIPSNIQTFFPSQ